MPDARAACIATLARLCYGRMRLLCDSMLHRLARWLRAAGYDTAMAHHRHGDRDVLDRAIAEDRLLLTCDRKMLERRHAGRRVHLLPANDLDGAARQLARDLGIDWLHRPFSRCLVDNAVLAAAAPEQHAAMPPSAQAIGGAVLACPDCGRLYWPGSHVRRMRRRLESWRAGA